MDVVCIIDRFACVIGFNIVMQIERIGQWANSEMERRIDEVNRREDWAYVYIAQSQYK